MDVAACYIAPTLIEQVPQEAQIMSEEIFGPVLPVITYRDLDTVVRDQRSTQTAGPVCVQHPQGPHAPSVCANQFGRVAINHCVLHYAQGNLPFGVNNSGIGNAHGHFGFKAFSHERAVLKSGPILMAACSSRPIPTSSKAHSRHGRYPALVQAVLIRAVRITRALPR